MSTQTPRISIEEQILDGEPHVEGTRIGVYFIYQRVERRGLEPRTVADRHGLHIADVYRALAYYHDHPDEMATIEKERERIASGAESDSNVATGPEDAPKGF